MKRVLFLVFACFALVADADLTQAQMQSAVETAIRSVFQSPPTSYNNAFVNSVPWLFPSSSSLTLGEFFMNGFDSSGATTFPFVTDIRAVKNLVGALSNLVQRVGNELADFHSDWETQVDIPLSQLDQHVSGVLSVVSAISTDLASLSVLVESQRDALSGLTNDLAGVGGVLSSNATTLADVAVNLDQVVQISESISSSLDDSYNQLYYIRQHTEDTADSASAIMWWLEEQLESLMIEAVATGVANVGPLTVDWTGAPNFPTNINVNGWGDMMSALSGIHGNLASVLGEEQIQTSNTTEIASTLGDFYQASTNFFESVLLQPGQETFMVGVTNSIATNVVVQAEDDTSSLDEMTNSISSSMFDDVFERTDEMIENPWNGGEVVIENLQDTAETLFSPGDGSSFTTEVVLMGSNDVGLPRVSFQLDDVLPSSWLSRLQLFMRALWVFVGLCLRVGLLGTWVVWYSQLRKAS